METLFSPKAHLIFLAMLLALAGAVADRVATHKPPWQSRAELLLARNFPIGSPRRKLETFCKARDCTCYDVAKNQVRLSIYNSYVTVHWAACLHMIPLRSDLLFDQKGHLVRYDNMQRKTVMS